MAVYNFTEVLVCVRPPSARSDAAGRALRGAYAGAKPGNDVLNRIAGLDDSGKLRPDVGTILPLREARRAHGLIQTGHTRGKIVLRVRNT
jgi:NADPH:quinone reductase-like Zn-dependent oxidoreductase